MAKSGYRYNWLHRDEAFPEFLLELRDSLLGRIRLLRILEPLVHMEDCKLDSLFVVYPGSDKYALAENIRVVPALSMGTIRGTIMAR